MPLWWTSLAHIVEYSNEKPASKFEWMGSITSFCAEYQPRQFKVDLFAVLYKFVEHATLLDDL